MIKPSVLKNSKKQNVCVVSSWFSCSLIDQQHGAQWAESKWELNRQHQGFVALCSLPAWGSKFSHHRVGWSPWRLQIALCFTPVSWMCFSFCLIYFFFFIFHYLSMFFPTACPRLSYVLHQGSCMQMKAQGFFFPGLVGRWAVLVLTIPVCVCVCVCAQTLVNSSRTVKVSSFPLCWPFDGMKESEGRGCLYLLQRCITPGRRSIL